ncbi:hypothetical protein THRCLA_23101 [Thraustotheca clavata]|uniref:Uncharacterized protein n=1 Tax=Thraustotheca clavata TaxID=74557 RepID=A0A1V9YED6_9STRA|nr:hypothetical protein THRCLA_23101 [Thraustotheca clavata]
MLWVELITGTFLSTVLIYCFLSTGKLTQLKLPATSFKYSSSFAYYFYLVFRLLTLALYIKILVFVAIETGIELFSFYTLWNFILQAIYFLWAIIYQIRTARSRYEPVVTTKETHYLNILFDVCFSNSIIIAIVYWKFIYEPSLYVAWYGYFEHAGNTIVLIIDFISNQFVISNRSWFFTIFFAAIYSVFVWISYFTWLDKVWPYTFLSMDTPYAPLWYVGIFAGHIISFGLAKLFSIIKERCLPTLCPIPIVIPQAINPTSYV